MSERTTILSQFKCVARRAGDVTIIDVSGELDVASAPLLEECVRVNRGARRVLMSLDALTYLDSRGLVALLNAGNEVAESAGTFELVSADITTRKLLEITGVGMLFTVHSTEAEALAAGDLAVT